MCAYNRINGSYACGYPHTLEHLRGPLGFEGFVVSDWWALHGEAHCGQPECRVSRRSLWRRAAHHEGRLVRPADYARRCELHPDGPFAIHFNGPAKKHLDDPVLVDWLIDSMLRESGRGAPSASREGAG